MLLSVIAPDGLGVFNGILKISHFFMAAGGYLFIFIQKKFPLGRGVQSCSLGFVLDDLEVISDSFFKGNSEQCVPGMVFCSSQHAAAGSTNPCHKKSYLDSQTP